MDTYSKEETLLKLFLSASEKVKQSLSLHGRLFSEGKQEVQKVISLVNNGKYRKISMAQSSLGQCKFIRDMGSSSQWGSIMAPGQEANDDN